LLPHEKVFEVRVPAESKSKVANEIGLASELPVFAAISGGWVIGETRHPKEIGRCVRAARRFCILPGTTVPPSSGHDEKVLVIEPEEMMEILRREREEPK